jgi:DNA-binding GntR family transcriptional regulator
LRILEQLWNVSERYVRLVFGPVLLDHGRAESLGHSHEELIEVARAGSPDGLRRAVRRHLDANEATIVAAIAEIGTH